VSKLGERRLTAASAIWRRYDVRLRDGTLRTHVPERHVILHSEDGPGALLRAAAAAGNRRLVEVLLEESVSCFEVDAHGNTPLHEAARNGHADICRCLLAKSADREGVKGADKEGVNFMHETPTDLARQGKRINVLRVFKPSGSDKDLELYHHACRERDTSPNDKAPMLRALCEKARAAEEGGQQTDTVQAMLTLAESCHDDESTFGVSMRLAIPSKAELLGGIHFAEDLSIPRSVSA
jgi:hypothetical protein